MTDVAMPPATVAAPAAPANRPTAPAPTQRRAQHSVSVAAVVTRDRDDRVLAIRRRDNGRWELPGGVLERDEDLHDGLIREVVEEAGVVVDPGPLTGVYKHVGDGIVALVYRCRVERRVWPRGRRRGDETIDVCWMTRAQVVAQMETVFSARVLDALDHRGAPAVRVHDGRCFGSAWQRWSARSLNPLAKAAATVALAGARRVVRAWERRTERGRYVGLGLCLGLAPGLVVGATVARLWHW